MLAAIALMVKSRRLRSSRSLRRPQARHIDLQRLARSVAQDCPSDITFVVQDEKRAAERVGDGTREANAALWHDDVQVVGRSVQQPVAHEAADQPGRFASCTDEGEYLVDHDHGWTPAANGE